MTDQDARREAEIRDPLIRSLTRTRAVLRKFIRQHPDPGANALAVEWEAGDVLARELSRFRAAPGHREGHGKPCYYCGEPCNDLAGNPGLWSLGFCHADDPGRVKWHHTECVTSRLIENRAASDVSDLEHAKNILGYTCDLGQWERDGDHIPSDIIDVAAALAEARRAAVEQCVQAVDAEHTDQWNKDNHIGITVARNILRRIRALAPTVKETTDG